MEVDTINKEVVENVRTRLLFLNKAEMNIHVKCILFIKDRKEILLGIQLFK